MTVTLTRGDKGFDLNFQVLQSNGKTPIDISTATVKFKMMPKGASENKVDAECTLVDGGSTGKCKYTVLAADLDTVGSYEAELEVSFTADKLLTAGLGMFEIEEDLPE